MTSRTLLSQMTKELNICRELAVNTPLVNPYQQLSYRFLGRMKEGQVTSGDLKSLIGELTTSAFICRAERAKKYLRETCPDTNKACIKALLQNYIMADGNILPFADFKDKVERDLVGIVITAHPTFGFSKGQYDHLANMISGEQYKDVPGLLQERPDLGLNLEYEFEAANRALGNLQDAVLTLYDIVLDVAQEHYPNNWTELLPRMVTQATWVGFDVDGRDDISWLTTIRFRYQMAYMQIKRYKAMVQELKDNQAEQSREQLEALDTIIMNLNDFEVFYDEGMDSIARDPHDIEQTRAFARAVADTQTAILPTLEALKAAIKAATLKSTDTATLRKLRILDAALSNFGLGIGHIHFRLNSVHLHNAIRPMVAMIKEPDESSSRRRYIKAVSKVLDGINQQTIGYESIMHEKTTAKRLFMMVAQIQKYIDPVTPIRFLIAESDTPFTVLAALSYAKLFGVDETVDISPLFETDIALARGAEVIKELLENSHYFAYVKKRKRLTIQTGYSDAGRYLGQVAAGLAIERLRMKLIRLWKKFDLGDVELVIFDTGGESHGRGAHPEGFNGRLNYMHSPESRHLVAENNVNYKQEFSLQGGDGYLWLQSDKLALATLTRVLENIMSKPEHVEDAFYSDTDWSLDFFLSVQNYNKGISSNPDYLRLISVLGTDVSYPSGSRMTIRSDEGIDVRSLEKLSQIRAIPNNMLLQQLGFFANSIGGVGTALSQDRDGFWEMYDKSPRLKHIMKLVMAAIDLTDEDILGAYAAIYRPRFWMHCGRYEKDTHNHQRMLRLAKMMENLGAHENLNRIELKLREDLMLLDDGMKNQIMDYDGFTLSQKNRENYQLLHVIRMAILQKMFTTLTRIPRFRDTNGISVTDLVMQILNMKVTPTLKMLKVIFPTEANFKIDEDNPENITYNDGDGLGYEYENRVIFDEIQKDFDNIRNISLAISGYIGAMG